MRDRFFFPAALALVVMMVFLAIRPGIGALPSGPVAGDGAHYDKITIEGDYLHKVFAGGNARTELVDGPDNKVLLFVEAETGALRDEPELGPHFRLAADIETQFSGMTVRITVRARPNFRTSVSSMTCHAQRPSRGSTISVFVRSCRTRAGPS